jgi:hypothetical protein
VRPRFARDGKSVWCGDLAHPARADVATGETLETLPVALGTNAGMVEELPDGRLVAVAAATGVALFDEDRTVRWLSHEYFEEVLAATPDATHALAVRLPDIGAELMALPFDGGEGESQRGSGVVPYKGLRVAPDRETIAWSTCHARTALARVGATTITSLGPQPEWDEFDASWIAGTTSIAEIASRGGGVEVWIVDRTGHEPPRVLPRRAGATGMLALVASPKGDALAIVYEGLGISVEPVAGGAESVVGVPGDIEPTFRRDGRALYFTRPDADGVPRVYEASLDGGDPKPLLEVGTSAPAASPVDDRLVFLEGSSAGSDSALPMIVDVRTHAKRPLSAKLARGRYTSPRFSPDGKRVAVLRGGRELVEIDPATGGIVRSVSSGASQLQTVVYTGTETLVVRGQWLGDVWMADDAF